MKFAHVLGASAVTGLAALCGSVALRLGAALHVQMYFLRR